MAPRYPPATWQASPNHTPGRDRIAAAVVHIAQGGFASALSWLTNPASKVSSHFLIGEDGRVAQLVALDDTAWTNGLRFVAGRWQNVRGKFVRPTWELLQPGMDPTPAPSPSSSPGSATSPAPPPSSPPSWTSWPGSLA